MTKAWNVMGGEVKWEAIPLVVDMLGVSDVEAFVVGLTTLREHQHEEAEREREREMNQHG